MRDLVPIVRALWYLLAGVMPATMPLFFAVLFLVWYEKMLALAGFLGLIAAALIPPDRDYPRVTSAVVLMLLCGVLVAGPLAYGVLREASEQRSVGGLELIVAPIIAPGSYVLELCLAMLRPKDPRPT